MRQAPKSHFLRKLMASLALLGTLALGACSGMTGGGNLGAPAPSSTDNSNLSEDVPSEVGSVGDNGLDGVWSGAVPADSGPLDDPEEPGDHPADKADYRLGTTDPLNGGFADPDKAVYHYNRMYFKKMSVLCVDAADHLIKVKMEGRFKTEDGDDRIFRVVDKPTMRYLDTSTHQSEGGYVSFVIVTRPSLPLKFFLLPKDYPVGALDTLLPCEDEACVKAGKNPIVVHVFMMDPHYDPRHVSGPVCPRLEKSSGPLP